MKVDLTKLRPNPWRDFGIDPIDSESSDKVLTSISKHGFWGGTALRHGKDGEFEIACGHTKIEAAIRAGITQWDLPVYKYDDAEMIEVYARENLTQRGDQTSAIFGVVASAVRYLIKGIFKDDPEVRKIFLASRSGLENVRDNIVNGDGIGYVALEKFFYDMPGMNEGVIKYHIANLKDSGEYAKIVKKVTAEIAKEEADERAELERREEAAKQAKLDAEKAEKEAAEAKAAADAKAAKEAEERAEAAKKKEAEAQAKLAEKSGTKKTKETSEKAAAATEKKHGQIKFDYKGVSKYIKTESQMRVFKKVVMREGMKKHIPVSAQPKLAALLMKYANKWNKGKLTGRFIEAYLVGMIKDANNLRKGGDLDVELSPEALQTIEYENAQHRFNELQHHFCRNWGGVTSDALEMIRLKDQYVYLDFKITQEMRTAIRFALPSITQLIEKLNIKT